MSERPGVQIHQTEFVALMAMLAATVAFSVDAMLPALPEIGRELSPDAPNRAQLIVTSFVLGMGLGTFVVGPVSDWLGRKLTIYTGAGLYVAGAGLAWAAPSLELMVAARIIQGIGAAGPRTISIAIVRDLYSGREMARILSIVMLIFTLVPAIAPTLGYGIIAFAGWRGIFAAFVFFSVLTVLWLAVRLPETLPVEARRPVAWSNLRAAMAEMYANPTVRLSTLVQTLCFAMLFTVLASTQQVFDQTYGYGDSFHYWFGGIALVAASASVVNAKLVLKTGMRALIKGMLSVQILLSLTMVAAIVLPLPQSAEFAIYVIWTTSIFFQAGLTIGNLNALAMEPVGHIAGIAASVVSSVATVGSVMIAVPLGLLFDGTPLPIAVGIAICAVVAVALTARIRRDSDA